jgi:DASH complex subunit SPC19
LANELAPAITTLLDRVESHLGKLERREQQLIAKSELQEGRLSQATSSGPGKMRGESRAKCLTGAGGEKALRLKALRQKKERLGYVVERLTLQQQQKQRQLRMSVNVNASANAP